MHARQMERNATPSLFLRISSSLRRRIPIALLSGRTNWDAIDIYVSRARKSVEAREKAEFGYSLSLSRSSFQLCTRSLCECIDCRVICRFRNRNFAWQAEAEQR